MSDPSLAIQKVIYDRLTDDDDLLALVSDAIFDRSGRPERFPCVVIGEGQTVFHDFHAGVHADLHVWAEEPGLVIAKRIGSAIIAALEDCPWQAEGLCVHDMSVKATRYLRDPSGKFSHGVLSYVAIVQRRGAA